MPLAFTSHEPLDHNIATPLGAAALALENQRLRDLVATRDGELRRSKLRLIEVIDEERHRIERNLHDGAQQQLVAVALKLNMLLLRIDDDLANGAELITEAVGDLMRTTDSLRRLAVDIHPPSLAEAGLAGAIEELSDRFPLSVEIVALPSRRLPRTVESTIYFLVAESLTNVAKHAQAERVVIDVAAQDGIATVEVRDDGVGGADPSAGTGLRGLADRIAAFDGRLDVIDIVGGGTLIRAILYFDAAS